MPTKVQKTPSRAKNVKQTDTTKDFALPMSPDTPGWTTGRPELFTTPSSPVVMKRVTRRTSVMVKKVSPLKRQRQSMYHTSNTSPAVTRARRASMRVTGSKLPKPMGPPSALPPTTVGNIKTGGKKSLSPPKKRQDKKVPSLERHSSPKKSPEENLAQFTKIKKKEKTEKVPEKIIVNTNVEKQVATTNKRRAVVKPIFTSTPKVIEAKNVSPSPKKDNSLSKKRKLSESSKSKPSKKTELSQSNDSTDSTVVLTKSEVVITSASPSGKSLEAAVHAVPPQKSRRSRTPSRTSKRSSTPSRTSKRSSTPSRTSKRSSTPSRTSKRSSTPSRTSKRSSTPSRTSKRSSTPSRGQPIKRASTPGRGTKEVATPGKSASTSELIKSAKKSLNERRKSTRISSVSTISINSRVEPVMIDTPKLDETPSTKPVTGKKRRAPTPSRKRPVSDTPKRKRLDRTMHDIEIIEASDDLMGKDTVDGQSLAKAEPSKIWSWCTIL